MDETNKITKNCMFLYFQKRLLTCSLSTAEGETGLDVVSKDG